MDRFTIGSGHFPILLRFGQSLLVEEGARPKPLDFSKAKWNEFVEGCCRDLEKVKGDGTVDEWNDSLCDVISHNVFQFIPQRKALKKRISVPWWNKACDKAVRDRNKAYRTLRM